MERRPMLLLFPLILITALFQPSNVKAGLVDPPFEIDTFSSKLELSLELLPAWTGLPAPVPIDLTLCGNTSISGVCQGGSNTVVHREIIPFVQGGRDTVDTELISMELVGTAPIPGVPVSVRVGEGNGFLPGLARSGGQIQDLAGSPQDLVIDFPADSIFDVFFDVWVDLNSDTVVDIGEVLRNFDDAIRMQNSSLSAAPPAQDGSDPYIGNQIVDVFDPNIGMFNSTMLSSGPLSLYVVNADGSQGNLHALATAEIHTPIPEPSSLALIGLGLVGLGFTRKKRTN